MNNSEAQENKPFKELRQFEYQGAPVTGVCVNIGNYADKMSKVNSHYEGMRIPESGETTMVCISGAMKYAKTCINSDLVGEADYREILALDEKVMCNLFEDVALISMDYFADIMKYS